MVGRRLGAVVSGIAILIAGALPARPQERPPRMRDGMRAYSVVPAGQEGNVSIPEFAAGEYGPHYADQLDMYASIPGKDLRGADMLKYFHSMQFGPGEKIERSYTPVEGATVHRDSFGIPHIYADSETAAAAALGYVSAEDRLWQMDVFRHAARGTLASFVGPGSNGEFLAMDIATRREGYSEAEIDGMFESFDDRFGKTGKRIQNGLRAYAEGVNAYMRTLLTDPSALPVEYTATLNPNPVFPTPWSPEDTLFLVVLQLRSFGETAGYELRNAGLYAHLVGRLGERLGGGVYGDLLRHNDPRSYTSIHPRQARYPAQRLGRPDMRSVAIPDEAEELAAGALAEQRIRRQVLGSMGFAGPASNAILVGAKESETGNPLQWGAPQVGYSVPQFFMDIDVHAPGMHFRGPAVPGASLLVPLGRGPDYAWSLTTGYSDAVDTRVEKLCRMDGEKPTMETNSYMFKGRCRRMMSRTETFITKPTVTTHTPPEVRSETFYRTHHGPVFARATVKGKPVALVRERFFWMKELDSLPAFLRWNTEVGSVKDFADAAADFTMSFNSFYADAGDIGYFHVGFLPQRVRGMHPSLPTWGTGRWEWRGRRPFRLQPKVVDPKQGWVVNWNNKPSVGWDNFDDYKWGSIHRVRLLEDGMRRITRGSRKASLEEVVEVAIEAGTRDPRGVYLGPRMLRWSAEQARRGGDVGREAWALVRSWVRMGSHRRNLDRDDVMDRGAALALFDRWYERTVHLIFDDELGKDGYRFAAPVSDYSPRQGSSFYFDFSGYLNNTFDPRARRSLTRNYCDNMSTGPRESCASQVARAFAAALAGLVKEQGRDPSKWTTPAENIVFSAQGAGSVPDIPWQNRGTHNHAVEVREDAGR